MATFSLQRRTNSNFNYCKYMQQLQYFAIFIKKYHKFPKTNFMQLIIKEVRESKKLTQDEIVELSGIKKRTYVDYENGKSDIPLSKLQNIANALKVNLFELFEGYNETLAEMSQNNLLTKLQFENEALRKENAELKKDKAFLQSLLKPNDHDKSQPA